MMSLLTPLSAAIDGALFVAVTILSGDRGYMN